MPKSSVQGRQALAYYITQIKFLYNCQVTIHGLDTGIHAGMTVYLSLVEFVHNNKIWSLGSRAIDLTRH
ncbi:MAG: hypothetical protein WCI11_13415 [Candidatus Methylumidiphilus sp.]